MIKIKEALEEMGLDPAGEGLLKAYLGEIEFWNPRYKLVAARGDELVIKHLLDSLAPWPHLFLDAPRPGALGKAASEELTVFDVGSGGGFPGIPLAALFPQHNFRLIEKSGRRVRFLESMRDLLPLARVTVDQRSFQQVRQRADRVIFRAVTPLTAQAVTELLSLLRPDGFIGAYKGKRAVAEEEIGAWPPALKDQLLWEILPVRVPGLSDERHLLRIQRKA